MPKKKATKKLVSLSPENYIRQKARNLPIAECLITPGWEEAGECNILVARRHSNENYTFGIYLVDTFCLGVKDAGYRFNISESEYDGLKENFGDNLEPISYNEAHNIVYGALAYAGDLGFRPHKDFGVAQCILEEDTEDIPLIEYEFGRDGKPFLIADTRAELNRYLPTLKKAVGNDYDFLVREGEEDYWEDEEKEHHKTSERAARQLLENLTDEERETFLKNMSEMTERLKKSELLPHTTYNYQYPDYPQKLVLSHQELEVLFQPENNEKLDRKTIDTILALPRETLIKDLEHCILYELGQNSHKISEKNYDENIYGSFAHALYLLAELKQEGSLPVVLEVMRQNVEFYEFFFGDSSFDILVPVIYQLAKNQLTVLLAYLKEPGLCTSFKSIISPVFELALRYQPERRAEITKLYADIFDFLYENINDTNYYDANFAGMLMNEPMNFCAKELLPKIKRLYDTGLVDEMPCGDFNAVEKEITAGKMQLTDRYEVKSIYEIYR